MTRFVAALLAWIVSGVFVAKVAADAPLVTIVSAPRLECARAGAGRPERKEITECEQVLRETVTRLRAELQSAGFVVEAVEQTGEQDDAVAEAERKARAERRVLLAVTRLNDSPAVDVRFGEAEGDEALVLTVRAPKVALTRVPALIALRTLELLRANAVVLDLPPPAPPQLTPAQVAAVPPDGAPLPSAAPKRILSIFRASVGAATLMGRDAIGPSAAPLLSLGLGSDEGLGIELFGLGPSFGGQLKAQGGKVDAHEALMGSLLCYRFIPHTRVAVGPSLGAGMHVLSVEGRAEAPYKAYNEKAFSFALLGGLTADVVLARKLLLTLNVHAYTTLPQAVVYVANERTGAVSRPSLFASLALGFAAQ